MALITTTFGGTVIASGEVKSPQFSSVAGDLSISSSGAGSNLTLSPGAAGQVRVTGGSLAADTIVTSVGAVDLSLSPTGSNINCNSKTLTNVAGITGSLDFRSGNVATTNASATTLVQLATATNVNYTLRSDVSAITPTGGAATNGASFSDVIRVINKTGTLTVNVIASSSYLDAALSAITVTYTISGTNLNVTVTGLGGTNISWKGFLWVTQVST